MWLVVGGAYAGKRRIVKERKKDAYWVSAYHQDKWKNFLGDEFLQSEIVFEGWEEWIKEELEYGRGMEEIRLHISQFFDSLIQQEEQGWLSPTLIMLEMGRGIVPLEKENRMWRDLAGWILQDAAKKSSEVTYVWNGLAQTMKK